jgi:hypothetical protein
MPRQPKYKPFYGLALFNPNIVNVINFNVCHFDPEFARANAAA